MPVRRKKVVGKRRALSDYERVKKWRKRNPWYVCLRAARQRCNNPNHEMYKNYGGRGIKCLLTLEDVKKLWVRDKAHKLKKASLDRIHEDRDYTFKNCKFIEFHINSGQHGWKKKQARNSPELSEPDEEVSFV